MSRGAGHWTGSARSGNVAFDWYPARDVGFATSPVPSLMGWQPPANPALVAQSRQPMPICISFDVIDTAGAQYTAPASPSCTLGKTGTQVRAASGTTTSAQGASTSSASASRQVALRASTSSATCPANGTWLGLPYLNRFWTGQTDSNGICTYYTGAQTFGTITLAAGTNYMESSVTVSSGATVTVPTGATIQETAGSLYVQGQLSVQAGVTFTFAQTSASLTVQGGTLMMAGTSSQQDLLTSGATTPAPGNWQGIVFSTYGGIAAGGTLNYAHVSYGGYVSGSIQAGIQFSGSNPYLVSVTVDFSLAVCLEINSNGNPHMNQVTCNQNGSGCAIQYDTPPIDLSQVSGLVATGNGQNAICIAGGTYSGTGTWQNVGIPILINGSITLTNGSQLTLADGLSIPLVNGSIGMQSDSQLVIGQGVSLASINGSLSVNAGSSLMVGAGTTLRFAPGSHSITASGGSLVFTGTAAAPIVLTSAAATPAPGDWQGAVYSSPNSSLPSTGSMSYTQVSDGGQTWGSCSSGCFNTGIQLSGSSPTLSHVTINSSSGNDVEVVGGVQPVLRGNNFGAVPSGKFGVRNDNWSTGQPIVDASYSWWGDPSGPTITSNPGGKGTPVSTGVNYTPWLYGPAGIPSIFISPSSGPAGSNATVSGSAFGANETITVFWNCQANPCTNMTTLGSMSSDAGGVFSNLSVQIPSAATPGSYPIAVVGGTSGVFATAPFLVPGAHIQLSVNAITAMAVPGVPPSSQPVVLTNSGIKTLNWSAASLPSWVSVSPTSGTLAPGVFQTLTVSFNQTALLAPGTYATSLTIADPTNADNSPVSIPVSLAVFHAAKTLQFSFTLGPGDQEWLLRLANYYPSTAHVTVTYQIVSASGKPLQTQSSQYALGGGQSKIILVNQVLGSSQISQRVQIAISSNQPIVATLTRRF